MPPIVASPAMARLPLSFAQQRLWFLDQLEPERPRTLARRSRLQGELDRAALERTLSEIVARHESLRTVFPSVDGDAGSGRSAAARSGALRHRSRRQRCRRHGCRGCARDSSGSGRPFDLENGPLFRALLVRIDSARSRAVLTMHHIVVRRLVAWACCTARSARCTGVRRRPAVAAARAADPVRRLRAWQREWLQGDVLERAARVLERAARGRSAMLELPTDRPRPRVQTLPRRDAHLRARRPSSSRRCATLSATRGRDAVHDAAGGVPDAARTATRARTTSSSARRSPAAAAPRSRS